MDRWDVLVILFAGYVAITALVRLMARRRNQVLDHVRQEIDQQLNPDVSKDQQDTPAADEDRDAA